MAKKDGADTIGAVGGLKIPPVDIWIAGYKLCAQKAVPGTKVLIGYSQDFVATDKCKTVATNEISQGARCSSRSRAAAGSARCRRRTRPAMGHRRRRRPGRVAKRVLTSGVKRVDNGVFAAVQAGAAGRVQGRPDLNFNFKNSGMGIGKINPSVPTSYIKLMNSYRAKIIAGKLKVPAALG